MLRLLLHIVVFRFLQNHFHTRFGEKFNQRTVLRHSAVCAQKCHTCLAFFIAGDVVFKERFGLRQKFRRHFALCADEFFDKRFERSVLLFVRVLRHGTGDNQGCPRIIDQDRIHLVNHDVMVFALYFFVAAAHHVITQVVEAEFVIRTVGNVAVIGCAAFGRVRAVIVDAVDGKKKELENRSDPFTIPLGKVIIDRYDVYALPRQPVEVSGQRRHEGLTLPRLHLGDFTVVQHHTADELYVVVHHVPGDVTAGGRPGVLPYGIVTLDSHIVFLRIGSQFAVVFGRGHGQRAVFGKAARRFFYHGKSFGQNLQQDDFQMLVAVFFQFVDFAVNIFFTLQIFFRRRFTFRAADVRIYARQVLGDTIAKIPRFIPQFVVAHARQLVVLV